MVPSPRPGWVLAALSMAFAMASGQDPKNIPSVENFLRRSGGTAAVIGDYIYYDGGEISQVPTSTSNHRSKGVNATISIDLSRSWDPSTLEMNEITKPPIPLNRQAMLVDAANDAFYIWGGARVGGTQLADPALWKFTADGRGGGTWSEETTELRNQAFFEQLDRVQGPACVSTPKRGYVFGGLSDKDTSPEPKSRIVGHVSLDFEERTWSQDATAPYTSTGSLFGASALHVPNYGKDGIIVLFGGTYDGSSKYNDFGTVNILDLETGEWHKQQTSGSKPSERALHCATGVAGNGTYEIFVYGGEIRNSGRSYSDMYVLSLPGFQWTRLAPQKSPPARRDHMCLTVGKRQMLSWGGLNTADGPGGSMWLEADAFPQGVGIFDMASLQWMDRYDAGAAAYETHESIREWYDDGPGISSVNWTSTEVETLFATQASSTPPSGGGGEEDPAPSNGTDSGSGSSTSAGVIAGAVVGGVVGLALVGGLVWFLLRKKRRVQAAGSPASDVTYASTGTEGYYPQQKTYAHPDAYKYTQHGGELDSHSPRPEMQGDSGRVEVPSETAPVEMADTSRR